MNTDEQAKTFEWITVDQGLAYCLQEDLPRTGKTIRSWCRNGHVVAQKQTTPSGERWVMDKASLSVKIRAEKEMQQQFTQVRTGSDAQEPLENRRNVNAERTSQQEPVQTGSNGSEQVQTGADQSEQVQTLQTKLQSLEIDKAVRDKQIEILTKQNAEGFENLLSQSRYIGHLETKMVQLGGKPDQTFLSAPVPGITSEPSNPDQVRFDVD